MNPKSITFLFPSVNLRPAGGYKVVYEYANRMAEDGWSVNIVYAAHRTTQDRNLPRIAFHFLQYLRFRKSSSIGRRWFDLNPGIREQVIPTLNYKNVPRSRYYVATAVHTALALEDYPVPSSCKLYLIQGYEDWSASREILEKSYRLGFKNIVISNWLLRILSNAGADATVIHNGFDFDYFRLDDPIEGRDPLHISMMYNKQPIKGSRYGLDALRLVHDRYPGLRVSIFGIPEKPENLPDWITYYRSPDRTTHNKIYNEAAIYVAPSLSEGWGLTVGEAMICGAAVVCTDTPGFQEMVSDGVSGIIVPTKNAEALARAITSLIENESLRVKLATKGRQDIQRFRWDASYRALLSLLEQD